MDEQDVARKVKEIVMEQLGVNEEEVARPGMRFVEDLGSDSLDLVELVMALEDGFNLEIPDEDAQAIRTVGDATSYIEQKVAQMQTSNQVTKMSPMDHFTSEGSS